MMMSLGGQIRSEISAQNFPLHDAFSMAMGSGALSLASSVARAIMANPDVRFSYAPLSVPPEYADVTSAEILVNLLNGGFNRSDDAGLLVHPNKPVIGFCNNAEYRFVETYYAMQGCNASGAWQSHRGIRLIVDTANDPLFVQKAPANGEEMALALTVGDVTIAGHTFPPGFLARIKVANGRPKIPLPGKAEKIVVDDVVSARILRMSAFVLSIEERKHWPPGDLVESAPLLDAGVTVASFVETARRTAGLLL